MKKKIEFLFSILKFQEQVVTIDNENPIRPPFQLGNIYIHFLHT